MPKATWFISDLHLGQKTVRLTNAFLRFLKERKDDCEALYILGDLFDYWIGDDYHIAVHSDIIKALKAFTEADNALYFIHGNRDFLIGKAFEERTGCKILTDPKIIQLYERQALILHGDLLCTHDMDYLSMREKIRHPVWQKEFLAKPKEERIAIAKQIRARSKNEVKGKSEEIMDVSNASVDEMMNIYNCNLMIHGHTHRPNRHRWKSNRSTRERIVLGDWDEHGWALRVDRKNFELQNWSLVHPI